MNHKLLEEALEILELPLFVNIKEIKSRYKELVLRYHPDRGGDRERFERVVRSYKILEEYTQNYRFDFSKDEVERQYPNELYGNKFKI